jgi:anti-anti-sigma factor
MALDAAQAGTVQQQPDLAGHRVSHLATQAAACRPQGAPDSQAAAEGAGMEVAINLFETAFTRTASMNACLTDHRSGLRLQVSGALDGDGALALRPLLEQVVTGTTGDLVLDMAEVGFMDGCGVGAVAFLFKRLAAQGRALKVVGATAQPLAMFRKLRLGHVLGLPAPARRGFGFAAALGFARVA